MFIDMCIDICYLLIYNNLYSFLIMVSDKMLLERTNDGEKSRWLDTEHRLFLRIVFCKERIKHGRP